MYISRNVLKKAGLILLISASILFVVNLIFLSVLSQSLEDHIYRTLTTNAVLVKNLHVSVSRLNWRNIWGGYLDNIRISTSVYQEEAMALEDVSIYSKQMYFSWPSWFKTRRLVIKKMKNALLTATVSETALNHFRSSQYPQFNLYIKINPPVISLFYNLDLYFKKFTLIYEGVPEITAPDKFSISPRRLAVANLSLPAQFIKENEKKLRLEIPVRLPLPVQLKQVTLVKGKIRLTWQEEHF